MGDLQLYTTQIGQYHKTTQPPTGPSETEFSDFVWTDKSKLQTCKRPTFAPKKDPSKVKIREPTLWAGSQTNDEEICSFSPALCFASLLCFVLYFGFTWFICIAGCQCVSEPAKWTTQRPLDYSVLMLIETDGYCFKENPSVCPPPFPSLLSLLLLFLSFSYPSLFPSPSFSPLTCTIRRKCSRSAIVVFCCVCCCVCCFRSFLSMN